MLVTVVLTGLTALVLAAPMLVTVGHRVRGARRAASIGTLVGWAVLAGELASRALALPTRYVVVAQVALVLAGALVVWARPLWNPVGHVFFSALLLASVSYLGLAAKATFAGGLSAMGMVASFLLLVLEAFAITISVTFAFESIDVACRQRWKRPVPLNDPTYRPFVSLHVPAFNEPPDMLIETIRSLEALDYPHFEIVVIDNNTEDEAAWRPVEEYCTGRPRVSFVHVSPWPGFKSGALNLVLHEHTAPEAEIIGVVDADYLVQPNYLAALVGHFADREIAFVQTPQDYREYEGDTYLTACYDAYKYFFETAMPSRNDRDSIIFGGTMGLIRRGVLEDIGGWDEWCITEDAEASLRMLRLGHSGLYVNDTYGKGIMPLTFTSLKKQRFRWCFGGVQILRKHWRSLMPWDRNPTNKLSIVQRLDYLFGGLQWFGDLAGLAFAALLVISAALTVTAGGIGLRALTGALVLVPVALIGAGLLRALWALRVLTGVGLRRSVLAFATWLSLSWTTALACIRGLVRRDGVFLRTPKWHPGGRLIEALRETRVETAFAAILAAIAVTVALHGGRAPLAGVAAWQALVFTCSPYMAWLNQRTELSARLARRARTEDRRDRVSAVAPFAIRTATAGLVSAAVLAIFIVGGNDNSPRQADVFDRPTRDRNDAGPLNLGDSDPTEPDPTTTSTIEATDTPDDSGPAATQPDAPLLAPDATSTTAAGTATTSSTATPPTAATTATLPGATATTRPGAAPTTPTPPTSSSPPSSGPPASRPGRP
ncbi:MAG: glycosyltransferase [Acidimicrobiales bacterium]|nr:glycosyltransferase [Acidimicrobiales bacterium]